MEDNNSFSNDIWTSIFIMLSSCFDPDVDEIECRKEEIKEVEKFIEEYKKEKEKFSKGAD